MTSPESILFPPFRLELIGEQLWHGGDVVALRPKTFAVLRHLAENPGRLVSKDELLDTVWARTAVSDTVLKSCVRELRRALGDDARASRYIETVHRRGYRFRSAALAANHAGAACHARPPPPGFVGRDADHALLRGWLDEAGQGERRIVFVTGEAGIGKTTLVEAFLADLDPGDQLWVGWGQCIEQYGGGEPYLPVLEALGRLGRQHRGEHLRVLLERHATWLVQLPALLDGVDLDALRQRSSNATPERRLREIAELLEALTAERTLVLCLEDLQWSDGATLELLAMVGRRREAARLLIVATYRIPEANSPSRPLRGVKEELALHGDCRELRLGLLGEATVREYLERRLGTGAAPPPLRELARVIHRRTDGNPLFMVNVVDDLVRLGVLAYHDGAWSLGRSVEHVASTVPDTLRHMIAWQLDRLDGADRRVVELASVAGIDFSAAAVAAGLRADGEETEGRCASLARSGRFLAARGGGGPDGPLTANYG